MRTLLPGFASAVVCAGLMAVSPSATASPYGEETVQDATLGIRKKVAPKKLHKLLIGNWTVRAPDAIQRQIQIMAIDPFNAAGSVTFKLEVYQLEEKLAEVFSIGSSMTTYFAERFQGSLKDTEHYTVTISDDDVAFQDITLTPWIQYTPALR